MVGIWEDIRKWEKSKMAKQFVKEFAKAGGTAYSYVFALEFPYQHNKTAWHCSDIPFVFHNTELVPVANIPEVSDKLEE